MYLFCFCQAHFFKHTLYKTHLTSLYTPTLSLQLSWVICRSSSPDMNIKAPVLWATSLSVVSFFLLLLFLFFIFFKKSFPFHTLTFSQHTSLFSSLLLFLWLTAHCTSPTQWCCLHTVLASLPLSLYFHPHVSSILSEKQYRGELTTVIIIALTYNG